MSFTRFHDDPVRIKKQLQISTFSGEYQLNRPGPGLDVPFYEDPNIRLQKWGANLHSKTVDFDSDLRGLTRKLNRDLISENDYKTYASPVYSNSYPTSKPFVEESRASNPAWMYRELPQTQWGIPLFDPQSYFEKPFVDNIQTRILEKDSFVPIVPRN